MALLLRGRINNILLAGRGAWKAPSSSLSMVPTSSSTALRAGATLVKNPSYSLVVKRTIVDSYNERILRSHLQQGSRLPAWLSRFLAEKPTFPRYTGRWWWEKIVMCVVFAITGSTTAFFVRPFIEKILHLEGSLWNGPWSYRVAYVVTITPIYSILLVVIGTLFGRHAFFKKFAKRMWTRMIPKHT